jgi:hypothetical protein
MRSRTVAPWPTYLSGYSQFCRPRRWTGYSSIGDRYNSIRQYAAGKSQYIRTGLGRQRLSHGIRHSSTPAPSLPFKDINSQTQKTADAFISSLPITRYLRSLASSSSSEPIYTETRPYRDMHPAAHTTHLVSASLLSPTKLPTDPIFFIQTHPASVSASDSLCNVIATCYIGRDLCGHPGYVHGGLSFVLFDDVFARCAAAILKSRTAMTASMSVDFRAPAVPDRVYVYRTRIVEKQGRRFGCRGR